MTITSYEAENCNNNVGMASDYKWNLSSKQLLHIVHNKLSILRVHDIV